MANSHEPLGVNVKGKQIAFKIRHSEKKVNAMKKLIQILLFLSVILITVTASLIGLSDNYSCADAVDTARHYAYLLNQTINNSAAVSSNSIDAIILWTMVTIALTAFLAIATIVFRLLTQKDEVKAAEEVKPPASRLAPRG